MYMLGIDLGTSYIKGGILGLDDHSISHVTRRTFPPPQPGLPPHHHEVDPATVIQATRELIDELAEAAPARACAGILISSQMHGFLLTDARGKPLTPLITWLDQRALSAVPDHNSHPSGSQTYFQELEAQLAHDEIVALGNGFKAGLPLCALYTLARQNRLPHGDDQQDRAVVWSLSDYVTARLAHPGELDAAQQSAMEPTIAASLGAYNFATGTWHLEILHKLGLDKLTWPRLVTASEVLYTIHVNGQDIPVYPSLGDHQCATLGSLLQPGELALNISTGSQVSLLSDQWTPSPHYESRPYFGGRSLNTVTRVPAGRSLTGLVQLLTEIPRRQGVELTDPWQTIAQAIAEANTTRLADRTPDGSTTALDVNLSFFGGAFGATGSITQITEENMSVGKLFLAAFDHMAQNYAQCAQWLGWPNQSSAAQQLVFAGGLAQRFDALRSAVTHKLQADYRMSPHTEDTLLGLLALGLVSAQKAADLDAAVVQLSTTYPA